MFLFLIFLSETSDFMLLLLATIAIISVVVLFGFLSILDYWFSFIIILSFLVGLFLLFIYLVSLRKKRDAFKNGNIFTLEKISITIFFRILLLTRIAIYRNFNRSMLYSNGIAKQELEWILEENSPIIIISMLVFSFFIIFLFFFMKKNKKMMKTRL